MALMDDQVTESGQAQFCPQCGEPAGNGRYCSSCGHALPLPTSRFATANEPATVAYEPAPVMPRASSAPPAGSGRSRTVLILAGALGVVAIAAAVIIIASSGSGSASSTGGTGNAYQQKLSAALSPLVSANQQLTGSLQNLDGSKAAVNAARRQTFLTQQALLGARGAANVLTVPASAQTISQQVQQALTDESGYLQAVSSTLVDPAGSNSQLQTLATGAQSAFVPLGAIVTGAGTSLGGADNLIGWSQGAAAASQRAQAAAAGRAARAHARAAVSGSSSSSSASGSATPVSSSTSCGGGVSAGPNTSCQFALNVHQAWLDAPGDANTVTVYSPVTNQTYTMSCAPAGSGITCSGGNNASVTF